MINRQNKHHEVCNWMVVRHHCNQNDFQQKHTSLLDCWWDARWVAGRGVAAIVFHQVEERKDGGRESLPLHLYEAAAAVSISNDSCDHGA